MRRRLSLQRARLIVLRLEETGVEAKDDGAAMNVRSRCNVDLDDAAADLAADGDAFGLHGAAVLRRRGAGAKNHECGENVGGAHPPLIRE